MSTQGNRTGFIVALIGGALGLIAFFAMPILTIYFVSVTAQQVTSLVAQYSGSSSGGQGYLVLWLAPIVCAVVVLVSALQFRAQATSMRAAGGWIIALGIVGIVLYIGILAYTASLYSNASSSASSFSGINTPSIFSLLGAGYWVFLLSMIAVIVGGAMGMSRKAASPMVEAPPSYQPPWSQPPQYPPNQPYQQYPPYPDNQQGANSSPFPPERPQG